MGVDGPAPCGHRSRAPTLKQLPERGMVWLEAIIGPLPERGMAWLEAIIGPLPERGMVWLEAIIKLLPHQRILWRWAWGKLLIAAQCGRAGGAGKASGRSRAWPHRRGTTGYQRPKAAQQHSLPVCARRRSLRASRVFRARLADWVVRYSVFGGGRARVLSGPLCCWPGTDASGQRPRKIRLTGKAMPGKKGPCAQIASREVRDARFRNHASAR